MAVKHIKIQDFDRRKKDILKRMKTHAKAFKNDTPDVQAARIERALREPLYFFKTYLSHWFRSDFCDEHIRWADVLCTINLLWVMAAFRGLGKSTFITFGHTLYEVIKGIQPYTVIVSETRDQSTNFTKAIKYELENNDRLRQDFGEIVKTLTGGDEDFICNGCRVEARSYMMKLRGLMFAEAACRPTCFKFDDMEDNQSASNRKIVSKKIRKVVEEARPGVSPDMDFKIVIVGNFIHDLCFIGHFLSKDKAKRWRKDRIGVLGPDGESIWPEMYPTAEVLETKEEMEEASPGSWYKEYMQDPREDLRKFHKFTKTVQADELALCEFLVGYIDAKAGDAGKGDYSAILVGGWAGDHLAVLHASVQKLDPESVIHAQYEIDKEFYDATGMRISWAMEKIAFQSMFELAYKLISKEYKRFMTWAWRVGTLTNKEARIESIAPLSNRGIITYCMDGGDMDELLGQLQWWPDAAHDDGPDALEGLVDSAQRRGAAIAGPGTRYDMAQVHTRRRASDDAFLDPGTGPDPFDKFENFGSQAIGQ